MQADFTLPASFFVLCPGVGGICFFAGCTLRFESLTVFFNPLIQPRTDGLLIENYQNCGGGNGQDDAEHTGNLAE